MICQDLSYTCIREGPDHAPSFKATVNFNGETFESPNYCSTLRQAEHSVAKVALSDLSTRGFINSLATRILVCALVDEGGYAKKIAVPDGIYLPEHVFSHGQLYIALSRGISMQTTRGVN